MILLYERRTRVAHIITCEVAIEGRARRATVGLAKVGRVLDAVAVRNSMIPHYPVETTLLAAFSAWWSERPGVLVVEQRVEADCGYAEDFRAAMERALGEQGTPPEGGVLARMLESRWMATRHAVMAGDAWEQRLARWADALVEATKKPVEEELAKRQGVSRGNA